MPLPHAVARTNRYWINPIARRLAGTVPPFILLRHVGRTSDRRYQTPVWAFPIESGFIIVLTYGDRTDWLRNLQATGHGEAVYRRQRFEISIREITHGDPRSQPLPTVIQWAVKLLGVRDFLIVNARPHPAQP